jgi:RecA/RadA recombinase
MARKAAEVKAEMNKKMTETYGKDMIALAGDVSAVFDIRLPTGIASIDFALGGGFPRGVISEIAGPDSAGKNALAYHTAGTYQKMRRDKSAVLICPIEGEVDKYFARKLGFSVPLSKVELKRMALRLGRDLTKEEIAEWSKPVGTVAYVELDSAEKMLGTVLRATKADDFGLVIIDSVAAMLAQDDLQRKVDNRVVEVEVGGERAYARNINATIGSFTNRFPQARKHRPHDRDNLTTVLAINQVRADVSGRGLPWQVPGARALKHAKRVDLWLDHGPRIRERDKIAGHMVRWNIAKGQLGAKEGAKGAVPFRYDIGFDLVQDLFDTLHGQELLVHTGGGKWDLVDGCGEVLETYGRDVGGKDGLIEAARADQGIVGRWRAALNTAYEIPPIFEGYDD